MLTNKQKFWIGVGVALVVLAVVSVFTVPDLQPAIMRLMESNRVAVATGKDPTKAPETPTNTVSSSAVPQTTQNPLANQPPQNGNSTASTTPSGPTPQQSAMLNPVNQPVDTPMVVKTNQTGGVTTALPAAVAANIPPPAAPKTLPATVSAPDTLRHAPPLPPVEIPTNGANTPVPTGLLNQTPLVGPNSGNSEYLSSAIAPKRYLFRNMSPTALEVPQNNAPTDQLDIDPEHFSPEAQWIVCTLTDAVITTNNNEDIRAAVWETFGFHGHELLHRGDLIIGATSVPKWQDRVPSKFTKIIFKKDGSSMPIEAIAKDNDGTDGIPGVLISDWAKQLLVPMLFDASGSFLSALENQGTVSQSALGTVVTSNNSLGTRLTNSAEGTGNDVFQKISSILSQDVDEYKPYVYLKPGTKFKVYLKKYIDTSVAELGK